MTITEDRLARIAARLDSSRAPLTEDMTDCRDLLAELRATREQLTAAHNSLIFTRGEADGYGSLLLDVQQDCITERKARKAAEAREAALRAALLGCARTLSVWADGHRCDTVSRACEVLDISEEQLFLEANDPSTAATTEGQP